MFILTRVVIAGAFARMEQHVLDDGVGALAVLDHLLEIALQQFRQLVHGGLHPVVDPRAVEQLAKLADQLSRNRREIVYEVQRILDLMGDARCELTQRGELFRLDQTILGGLQVV